MNTSMDSKIFVSRVGEGLARVSEFDTPMDSYVATPQHNTPPNE